MKGLLNARPSHCDHHDVVENSRAVGSFGNVASGPTHWADTLYKLIAEQSGKPSETNRDYSNTRQANTMSAGHTKEHKSAVQRREIKGLEIAAKLKLGRKGNTWHVPSQSNKQEKYTVALTDDKPQCTCRDYEFRNDKCKHIFAVEYTIEREQTADGQTVTTETVKVVRKTYSQNWPAYNAAQTHEKSELQALLHELCRSVPEPEQRMGRPRLSLADIIFSSTFKVYSTVSGRRFMSDLREAKARGFLAKIPSYNLRNSSAANAQRTFKANGRVLRQTRLLRQSPS